MTLHFFFSLKKKSLNKWEQFITYTCHDRKKIKTSPKYTYIFWDRRNFFDKTNFSSFSMGHFHKALKAHEWFNKSMFLCRKYSLIFMKLLKTGVGFFNKRLGHITNIKLFNLESSDMLCSEDHLKKILKCSHILCKSNEH